MNTKRSIAILTTGSPFAGYPGIRASRQTDSGWVSVFENPSSDRRGRFATYCHTHDVLCREPVLKRAVEEMPHTVDFCPGCRADFFAREADAQYETERRAEAHARL